MRKLHPSGGALLPDLIDTVRGFRAAPSTLRALRGRLDLSTLA
jgi:hypothetical protein